MKYVSTRDRSKKIGFKDAALKGLADDGGLFMPEALSRLNREEIEKFSKLKLWEIGYEISKTFIDEIDENNLREAISSAINFDAPIKKIKEGFYVLELFHGPTCAFKDFGARFMANIYGELQKDLNREIDILVATSGDTGGAIGSAFYGIEGVRVHILYPSGGVSSLQEKQIAGFPEGNVTAIEVNGSFDDCQRLVKASFADTEMTKKLRLTSANSINICRLIPQTFYYFGAYAQLPEAERKRSIVFSTPSGNFGNLTAGLMAKKMGLPVFKFVASTNVNDAVPKYLETGIYETKKSVKTRSNAMDVGAPSNFERIKLLFDNDLQKIRDTLYGASFGDDETIAKMEEWNDKFDYQIDPHTAVGVLGMEKFLESNKEVVAVSLSTAHPAKFLDEAPKKLAKKIETPDRLNEVLSREKKSIKMKNSLEELKKYLTSL